MSSVTNWFKDNQVLVIGLIGQAIVLGIYMVNLEARVSILEDRGSPHLTAINTRLTTLEKITENNSESLRAIKEILTRRLNINP